MKIQKSIAKRVAKFCKLKPELATPFFQNGYEHVTNTFYGVRIPVTREQPTPDRANTPIINIVYQRNEPKDAGMRFTLEYLRDVLSILEDNGANYIDLYKGDHAVIFKGYDNFLGKVNTGDAIVMKVAK